MTAIEVRRLEFPVRRGRNAAALVLLVVLSALAFWVAFQQRADLGLGHWWVPVFPVLAIITAYRHVRPRVPLVLDAAGLAVSTGTAPMGLRAHIPWSSVKRLRVTAMGMLLVELKTGDTWVQSQPWLVRANVRANENKSKAAVVQPLRELQGSPETIIEALRAAAPVPVDAPRAPKAGA